MTAAGEVSNGPTCHEQAGDELRRPLAARGRGFRARAGRAGAHSGFEATPSRRPCARRLRLLEGHELAPVRFRGVTNRRAGGAAYPHRAAGGAQRVARHRQAHAHHVGGDAALVPLVGAAEAWGMRRPPRPRGRAARRTCGDVSWAVSSDVQRVDNPNRRCPSANARPADGASCADARPPPGGGSPHSGDSQVAPSV